MQFEQIDEYSVLQWDDPGLDTVWVSGLSWCDPTGFWRGTLYETMEDAYRQERPLCSCKIFKDDAEHLKKMLDPFIGRAKAAKDFVLHAPWFDR